MQINLPAPEAARLYTLIGSCLWLQKFDKSYTNDELLLEAVKTFLKENLEEMPYPGVSAMQCMNNMQNAVYRACCENSDHVRQQSAALRQSNNCHKQ